MSIVKKINVAGTDQKEVAKFKKVAVRSKKKISRSVNVPSRTFSQYAFCIHGDEGIGKTTLVGMFEKIYFIMLEPNESYRFYFDKVVDYQDFLDYKDDFLKGDHDYLGICIDNPLILYDLAMNFTGKKYGFEHPGGQNDYGASWNRVKKSIVDPLIELMNSKYGFSLVCHSIEKEITTLSGKVYNKIAPDMPKQPYSYLIQPIPNIFYYHFTQGQRWLQIVGDEHVVAKNRMDGHFLTPSGERIFKIPMGGSAQEAYNNLMKAFNNLQNETYQTTFTPTPISQFKKVSKVNKVKK
jgi:hypothetical protein